jgi:hypothetical protein
MYLTDSVALHASNPFFSFLPIPLAFRVLNVLAADQIPGEEAEEGQRLGSGTGSGFCLCYSCPACTCAGKGRSSAVKDVRNLV